MGELLHYKLLTVAGSAMTATKITILAAMFFHLIRNKPASEHNLTHEIRKRIQRFEQYPLRCLD